MNRCDVRVGSFFSIRLKCFPSGSRRVYESRTPGERPQCYVRESDTNKFCVSIAKMADSETHRSYRRRTEYSAKISWRWTVTFVFSITLHC